MSEKRFVLEISPFSGEHMKFLNILDNGKRLKSEDIVDLLNEQQSTIQSLKEENERLNDVITNLHNELRQYSKKVKKQHMLINIQWDIIACLMELKGVIDDD